MRQKLAGVLFALLVFAPALRLPAEGQNKVQYQRFDWQVYHSPHFDIYYYPEEQPLLEGVLSDAESAYRDISDYLGHTPPFRIPLIYYKTHAEFEQTNVTLDFIPEAVGGFTEPLRNRMVIPVDQTPDKRYQLIRHEMTHVFEFSIIYEGSIGRLVRGRAPLWIMEGLAEHIGKMNAKDPMDDVFLRDAALNDLVPSVKDLDELGFMTYRIGEAIFDFIREEKGKAAVSNFLWEYRKILIGGSIEKAIKDSFGLTVPEFDQAFRRWLRKKYLPLAAQRDEPLDYGPEIRYKNEDPRTVFISPALSPSGDLVAAITNRRYAAIDVVVLSVKDGKVMHTLTPRFTNRYESLVIAGLSGGRDLAWAPDGDHVAFIVKNPPHRELYIANARGGIQNRIRLTLDGEPLANAQSPSYSPDGSRIAFSANYKGQVDLFYADLNEKTIGRLTSDTVEDYNPRYSTDGKTVIYNARLGQRFKLFTVDATDPARKTQLSFGESDDILPAFAQGGKSVLYSSAAAPDYIYDLYRLDLATGTRERLSHVISAIYDASETGAAPSPPSELKPIDRGPLNEREKRGEAPPSIKEQEKEKEKEKTGDAAAANGSAPATAAPPADASVQTSAKTEAGDGLNSEIVFATFYRGTFALVRGNRLAVMETLSPAAQGSAAEEVAPFRPPLQLRPEDSASGPYKPFAKANWSVEAPQVEIAVADDGTIFSNGRIVFADVLGNQRVALLANSVDGFTNINLSYLNRTRRLAWGGAVFDQRAYYYAVRSDTGNIVRLENHNSGALAFSEYPFSRFFRADLGAGYYSRTNQQFTGIGFNRLFGFFSTGDTVHSSGPFVSAGLSFDSARYGAPAWAIHGLKVDLSLEKGFSGGGFTDTDVAVRKYAHIAGRSLLAWRTVYHESRGPGLTYTSLGGFNTLRGYRYAEFFGSRQFFTNVEFRVPLIDHLVLPWLGGLDLRGIRLAIFFDAGAAWLRADDLRLNQTGLKGNIFIDPEAGSSGCIGSGPPPRKPPTAACNVHEFRFWAPGQTGKQLQDGRASYGFDWSFFLGPLELHWDYTRRWDLKHSGPGFGTDFYIGYTW